MAIETVWGMILVGYLIAYASWEVWRQVATGRDSGPDRWSAVGAGTLLSLVGMWTVRTPPGFALIFIAAVAVAVAAYWLRARRNR